MNQRKPAAEMCGYIKSSRDQTSPRTLLLLHGSASSRQMWKALGRALASIYNVVTPDLIGYGEASVWELERPLSLDDELAQIELISASAEPLDIVGYSYGGAVAMALARRHPARIRSLTLIEPVVFPALLEAGQSGEFESFVDVFEQFVGLRRKGNAEEAMAGFIDFWSGPNSWKNMPNALRESMCQNAPKIERDWQASFQGTLPSPDILLSLGPRTLLVRGDRSPQPMCALVDALKYLMPQAGLLIFKGAGHLLPITHQTELLQALQRHLEKIPEYKPATGSTIESSAQPCQCQCVAAPDTNDFHAAAAVGTEWVTADSR